jgi:hypothetical protein
MKSYILKLIALALVLVTVLVSSSAFALDCATCSKNSGLDTQQAIECGTSCASGNNQTPGQAVTQVNTTVQNLITYLSIAVGAVAVIMIIIGGFRYVTSAGSSERITGAKNTILYALIGLLVAAIAQISVHFVLNQVTCINGKTSSGQKC